jgi:hypothetical protein
MMPLSSLSWKVETSLKDVTNTPWSSTTVARRMVSSPAVSDVEGAVRRSRSPAVACDAVHRSKNKMQQDVAKRRMVVVAVVCLAGC